MMTEHELINLIEKKSRWMGLSEATLCERAVGNSRLHSRLVGGGSCSLKTIAKLQKFLSNSALPSPSNVDASAYVQPQADDKPRVVQ